MATNAQPEVYEVPKPINRAALFAKIAATMGELERIPKTGWNDHFKYHYSSDGDVNDAVRHAMANNNLALLVDMRSVKQEDFGKTGNNIKFTVEFEFTLACGDTGATWSSLWTGEALDTQDKGINKAATSAEKYFLMKTFVVSTGDAKDDPDSQSSQAHWADDVEKQKIVVQALEDNDVTKEEVLLRLERGNKLVGWVQTSLDLAATLNRIIEIGKAKKAAANGSPATETPQDAPEQGDTPDGAQNGVETPQNDAERKTAPKFVNDKLVDEMITMTDLGQVYDDPAVLKDDMIELALDKKIKAKSTHSEIEKAISSLIAERDAQAEFDAIEEAEAQS